MKVGDWVEVGLTSQLIDEFQVRGWFNPDAGFESPVNLNYSISDKWFGRILEIKLSPLMVRFSKLPLEYKWKNKHICAYSSNENWIIIKDALSIISQEEALPCEDCGWLCFQQCFQNLSRSGL